MTVTTVIDLLNQSVAAADVNQSTDFFIPNSNGSTVPAGIKSWKLTVDKTGLTAGVKYLTIRVEYLYSAWQLDVSNEPDGWVGGVNHLDGGATSFIDYISSQVGSYDANHNPIGSRPTKARLHIMFSSGFTSPEIKLQVADDLSLA